ncbi:MAG: hypothetical protein MUD08_15205, partial [Cytophagales bacterium]|nr:hypothetical protein [Cytophagales bacterium]
KLELREGRLYPSPMGSVEALRRMDLTNLVRQGYVAVRVASLTPAQRVGLRLPVHVLDADDKFDPTPGEGKEANFLLFENGKVKYAVANGFLFNVE